ncbi:MAG: FecR domain-containing protein [Methylobacteriaceae bacterium]|nr:FecR domain-containing protein [Methylobacteriaceae bacterium]
MPRASLVARRAGGFALALSLGAVAAHAAPNIGQAISIAPQVSGAIGSQSISMTTGDGVVQNESIQTAAAGSAHLRFIDATDLSIGPSSAIKLDRFVFNPGGSARSFVLDASKGAFRFATGNSNHDAYEINTPAAVIGVRGTRFSFDIVGTRLTLTVSQGQVIVCPRGLPRSSCFVASAGQTIAALPGRAVAVLSGGPSAPPPPPSPPPPIYTPGPTPIYGPPEYGPSPPVLLPPGGYRPWPPRGNGYWPPRGPGRWPGGLGPSGPRGSIYGQPNGPGRTIFGANPPRIFGPPGRRPGRRPGTIWPPFGGPLQ